MAGASHEQLSQGEVAVLGRMPWSSNATFLAEVCLAGEVRQAIYKPVRGERPLWDFPAGLYRRELAAYHLSEALGWRLVPTTVERDDAPLGQGSLQRFVDADLEQHYFTLYDDERWHDQLRTICMFDLLVNNTDRKSGHCLLDGEGHIWAIDNALTFHAEFKLRTVIWEFGGQPMPEPLLADVERLLDRGLPVELEALLDPAERLALVDRATSVVHQRTYPVDHTGRRYPWPLV
jgi:uncharacterized repeat protein (TIGR03843 family)